MIKIRRDFTKKQEVYFALTNKGTLHGTTEDEIYIQIRQLGAKSPDINKMSLVINDTEGKHPMIKTKEEAKKHLLSLLEHEELFTKPGEEVELKIKLDKNGVKVVKLFMNQEWEEKHFTCELRSEYCSLRYFKEKEIPDAV